MPIKDGNLASQEKIYDAFFSATDAQEIEQLIPLLNDFYYQLKMDEKGKCISQEKITPLEIAAEEGKLAQGNVALVMAAGLSKSEIFNTLLQIDALKHQLEESALVSLFSATMQMNGLRKPKEDINQEIINQLFNIPSVYAYALTREFDFGELIAKYHDSKTETTLGFKQRFLLKINEGNPSAEETDVESSSALESNRSNSEENASDTSSTDDSCVAKTWRKG